MSEYDRIKKWREKNRSHYNETMAEYRCVDDVRIEKMITRMDEVVFETETRARRRVLQSTPRWVERSRIRSIYEDCVRMARRAGTRLFVIHAIPIMGKTVCGLHVEDNLLIVREDEKQSRGRKFHQDVESQRHLTWLRDQGL